MTSKHIHFIGICGVGMGALAILWQKKGWKVTGSDVGFYPPISTHLKNHNIEFYSGWHPEKMGTPDLVVVGNVAGSQNPELIYVLDNKISNLSYPELIEQFLIKKNSIVCAGTFGKTSSTALLAKILIDANFNPAYMFGALSVDLNMAADDLGGEYSIVEGDEYKTSRTDLDAKFFHYHPTHLLLTATEWDHADIYPTETDYLNAFKKLAKSIPKKGTAIISEKVKLEIVKEFACPLILYGTKENCDYQYFDVVQNKSALSFKIKNQSEIYNLKSEIIGDYMADNICGAFATAVAIGIKPEQIIGSIANFHGLKRRLEKRGIAKSGAIIFDDIAHSPTKAQFTLATLRKIFTGKLIAVFEPNIGNRQPQSAPGYASAFADATEVIIPRLTIVKSNQESKHWTGVELAKIITTSQPSTKYIDNDTELVNYLTVNTKQEDVIVFLGSHGFRGMIEELLK